MSFREYLEDGFLFATIASWFWLLWTSWKASAGLTLGQFFVPLLFYIFVSTFFPILGFALFRLPTRRSDTLVGNIGAWLGMLVFVMTLQVGSYGKYIPFVQGTIAGFTLAFMLGWNPDGDAS